MKRNHMSVISLSDLREELPSILSFYHDQDEPFRVTQQFSISRISSVPSYPSGCRELLFHKGMRSSQKAPRNQVKFQKGGGFPGTEVKLTSLQPHVSSQPVLKLEVTACVEAMLRLSFPSKLWYVQCKREYFPCTIKLICTCTQFFLHNFSFYFC